MATGTTPVTNSDPKAAAGSGSLASKHIPTYSAAALLAWFKTAGVNFSRIQGTTWASSFAYYAFFALVPLLLLLLTLGTDLAAHFVGEEEAKKRAFKFILANVPLGPEGQRTITDTLHGVMESRGKIGLVALVGLLWSSLSFFQAMVNAINAAWNTEQLSWWKLPIKNLQMVGVLVSALVVGTIVPAFLRIAQGFVNWGGTAVSSLFNLLIVLVPAVVLFYGFLLFYKIAPRKSIGVTFTMVWFPALLVTFVLQLCQQLFVWYSTKFTDFNAVYGAFGGVIALMLWSYIAGSVIVFGGCLCAAQREIRATPEGPAGLVKP